MTHLSMIILLLELLLFWQPGTTEVHGEVMQDGHKLQGGSFGEHPIKDRIEKDIPDKYVENQGSVEKTHMKITPLNQKAQKFMLREGFETGTTEGPSYSEQRSIKRIRKVSDNYSGSGDDSIDDFLNDYSASANSTGNEAEVTFNNFNYFTLYVFLALIFCMMIPSFVCIIVLDVIKRKYIK